MNHVILMGRLTRDPDVRYSQGEKAMCIARYTLAIDRPGKDSGADFISCVAFDKRGEFAEKHLHKGTKIAVNGRIQTGSYTNREGQKVYTTDVVVEHHEFCEKAAAGDGSEKLPPAPDDGFMEIPDDVNDEGLPFN